MADLFDVVVARKLSGGGGGGGSSDFSTATVTLINTDTSTQYFFRADSIQNDGIKETTVSVVEPVDVEIPLYKGNHTITIMSIASNDMDVLPTGTGGVTVDMPNMSIIITGDGTLTAKGMPAS